MIKHAWILTALAACSGSDESFEQQVTTDMHAQIESEVSALIAAAQALQSAAPERAWSAEDLAPMRAAWRDARVAYEHTEGALAPLFPDIDFVIDARYDDFLAEVGPDTNLFDGEGVTGMHAIERILFADEIRPEVVAFERTLPGYQPAAIPATDADARAFKTGLVQRLIDDVTELHAQWRPANIDIGAAYVGLVGLMNEQKEKVDLASTGEEESRYANVTLFDLRNNREGTLRVYSLFRAWVQHEGGGASDAAIQTKLGELAALYATTSGDALPPVPETWSSDMPSSADLATPFGRLWQQVHAEVDPAQPGSIVAEMNTVATLLGFAQFVEE